VAKKRSAGQTLIGVAIDESLLVQIDKARGELSRSAFVRQALGKYLGLSGAITQAPDRAGKGGRPRKVLTEANTIMAASPEKIYRTKRGA
jgi:hypothetical protein